MSEDLICKDCGSKFSINVPTRCMPCHPGFKEIQKIEKQVLAQLGKLKQTEPPNKWKEIKRFSYHFLLYIIPAWFIGIKWGVNYELTWIFGGIYMSVFPIMRDWFMKIF
jgi:hypothetical protein